MCLLHGEKQYEEFGRFLSKSQQTCTFDKWFA